MLIVSDHEGEVSMTKLYLFLTVPEVYSLDEMEERSQAMDGDKSQRSSTLSSRYKPQVWMPEQEENEIPGS